MANCYIKPFVNFKINQKEELIEITKAVVREFVVNNRLMENPLIDRIFNQGHSQKSINANLGAWWRKDITLELIENAIQKKETKLKKYRKNRLQEQWLLIVIGSTGESSYDVDQNLELKLQTSFDRIYVLEDFENNLYQLK